MKCCTSDYQGEGSKQAKIIIILLCLKKTAKKTLTKLAQRQITQKF